MSFLNRLFNKPKKSEENNMDEIVSNTTSTSNTDKPFFSYFVQNLDICL